MTASSTWTECRLNDLLSIKHGFAFKGEYFGTSGPYVLVTPGNFFDEGGFKYNGDKQKRYNGPVPKDYLLIPGSLIVAMTEQAEGLLGSAALVPNDGSYLHNQRIGLICNEKADRRFLYYLLNTPRVRRQIRATSSGTKVRHTSPSRIGEAEVCVPAIAIQQRIAGILAAYDDLIEVNQRRIGILEEIARRLFDEWFVRFRYPGHEGVPLIETELGPAPPGWKPKQLSYWADDFRNTVLPCDIDPATAYLGLEHLPRRSTTLIDFGRAGDVGSAKLKFDAGDVLFGKIRPYFHKVGYAAQSGVCSTDAIVIRAKMRAATPYVLGLVSSDPFVAHSVATSNGTKMPRADWKVLRTYPLFEPPTEILDRYCKLAQPAIENAANLAAQNGRLRTARDLLLPKLISGNIDLGRAERDLAEAAE